MADIVQFAAPPQAIIPLESKGTLQWCLDDLLERYLNLLDQYQKLQQDLMKNMSNGYLSLAQANFSNANRIRYSQDYYDDRMQATARFSVNNAHPLFSTATSTTSALPTDSEGVETENETPSNQRPDEDKTPIAKEKGSVVPRDPLHWFGILLPQALRSAQCSFQLAVTNSIPALASISKEMKEVEIEIRRARKKLKKAG